MRPLAFLHCIARAALKGGANVIGFGLGDVVEQVWKDWNQQKEEAARQAELQVLVQMAGEQFRQQVEAVVRSVAAGQPAEVQQRLSHCLQQVPDLVRRSFCRPDDQQGRSVPPGFRLKQASDLATLLSSPPAPPLSPEARVTVQLTAGHGAGEAIVCTEPTLLLFGRASDCKPAVPRPGHEGVSRHHLLLDINPPDVTLRDLGSLRGTFLDGRIRAADNPDFTLVNGMKLGGRPKGTEPDAKYASPEYDLADGVEVRLAEEGQVAFRVQIHVPARCAACQAVIPEEQRNACARSSGGFLCANCRRADREAAAVVKECAWCHREVTAERGANRPGLYVCGDCRSNLQAIMQDLTAGAHAGSADLRAVRGYTLLEELGHGGMGAVYLARHERTGQPAAIKLMLPRVAADDRAVELFRREVRNTMSLQHRHVVRCLDHGYARGTFFLILEYCEGGSVDQLMAQRGGTLPVDEAVEITLQALEGLEYTHQADIPFVKQKGGGYGPGKGLVHRDLKPANLFLTGWGSGRIVKLGDYGLAKAFEETGLSGGTRTGEAAGTWQFMCRSQVIDSKRAGPEVDVWALAASLYDMLTGFVPRDFSEKMDPWLIVLEREPVPILQRNPSVPPRLAEVIDRALVEEPDFTFRSAAEFQQALENAL
jgi:serine/threonine-protein kinase